MAARARDRLYGSRGSTRGDAVDLAPAARAARLRPAAARLHEPPGERAPLRLTGQAMGRPADAAVSSRCRLRSSGQCAASPRPSWRSMFAPAAHAASLNVSPQLFSPARGRLAVAASLTLPRQVGVQLVTPGRSQPRLDLRARARREISLPLERAHQRRPRPDGRYLVRLVFGSPAVAETPLGSTRTRRELGGLRVGNGSTPFAGDGKLLTTISPNGDGFRDEPIVRFRLVSPRWLTMEVGPHDNEAGRRSGPAEEQLAAGRAQFLLDAAEAPSRVRIRRLTTGDAAGNRGRLRRPPKPSSDAPAKAPVVRLQGIDAAFTLAELRPRAGRPRPNLYRCPVALAPTGLPRRARTRSSRTPTTSSRGSRSPSAQTPSTGRRTSMRPTTRSRSAFAPWPSGLYYAAVRLAGRTHRLRPVRRAPGAARRDQPGRGRPADEQLAGLQLPGPDGNGYGDTWYARRAEPCRRPRPRRTTTAASRRASTATTCRSCTGSFWTGKTVDFISDADLQLDRAAATTSPGRTTSSSSQGHEEYVTEREYDLVTRYRDVGGNLMFLSANNFFWRCAQGGPDAPQDGRSSARSASPEARLLGVQYRANDDGRSRASSSCAAAVTAPWLWTAPASATARPSARTSAATGSRSTRRPPSRRRDAGARGHPEPVRPGDHGADDLLRDACGRQVFAAGALDFGGSATFWPVWRMLDNVWARLAAP